MIVLKDINKTFKLKDKEVTAVRDVNLTIEDKEIYGIIGFSGAEKSSIQAPKKTSSIPICL